MLWLGMEARRLHTLAEIGMLEKNEYHDKIKRLKGIFQWHFKRVSCEKKKNSSSCPLNQ